MSVDRSDIEKVAKLARLQLEETSIPQVTDSINNILGLVDQMQAIDTSGVEPLANPLDAVQRLRADEVSETDQRDQLMAGAPAQEDGLFLVPKVIE